jgi:hypothetical protein
MIVERKHSSQRRRFAVRSFAKMLETRTMTRLICCLMVRVISFTCFFFSVLYFHFSVCRAAEDGGMLATDFVAHYSVIRPSTYIWIWKQSIFPCCIRTNTESSIRYDLHVI